MKTVLSIILLVVLVVTATGCGVVKKYIGGENGPLRGLVVDQVQGDIDGGADTRELYISGAERLRDYVNASAEVRADRLGDYARELLEQRRDELSSERYAAIQLTIVAIEEAVERYGRDDLDELRVLTVLDWVEQAAYSAEVPDDG